MNTVGLIAEDQSDVDVLYQLIQKLAHKKFAVRKFLGFGCGRIHAKARVWAEQLHRQGCSILIVVSDLDRRELGDLSAALKKALHPCPIRNSVIVIPIREIEAWLLSDHAAITTALKLSKAVKKQANPESIANPKERLRDLIKERSKGRIVYLNTIHNTKIAAHIETKNLRRCTAFHPFETFVRTHL